MWVLATDNAEEGLHLRMPREDGTNKAKTAN